MGYETARPDGVDYELVGEADAVHLIERQSVRRVDLECFTLHQLRDGRLLVDFLSGSCAVLHGRERPPVPHHNPRAARAQRPLRPAPGQNQGTAAEGDGIEVHLMARQPGQCRGELGGIVRDRAGLGCCD